MPQLGITKRLKGPVEQLRPVRAQQRRAVRLMLEIAPPIDGEVTDRGES
jgi:hypothetical protein